MRTFFAVSAALVSTILACASPTETGSAAPCAPSDAVATINATDSFSFGPDSVTVIVGQSVCWQNKGQQIHTVTDIATNGVRFNGPLPGGQAFIHNFGFGGTFEYRCNNHAGMIGIVVVKCLPDDLVC